MVNHADSIKSLQDTATRHDQVLTSLQNHVEEQKLANAKTQQDFQEVMRRLAEISLQLGRTTHSEPAIGEPAMNRGKAKMKTETDDDFPFPPKPVFVELPLFTGQDPEEWVASAQDFFDFYGTEDHHRVTMASFRMDGVAKKWFRWMQRRRQLAGWNHLVEAIRKRFAVTEIESPEGQLTKLTQTATVEEYQTRFEDMVLRTTNLPEEFLTQCFISGLRSEIKGEVLGQRPTSMNEAMALARFHEARFNENKKLWGRATGSKPSPLLPTPPTLSVSPRGMPGRPPQRNQPSRTPTRAIYNQGGFRPLKLKPDARKGGEGRLDSQEEDLSGEEEGLVESGRREQSLVSFNALAGCYAPNTLRVKGEIQGRTVRILIDGGSTHNFVQSRVAKHLGLPVVAAPNFRVLVGNGEKLRNEGCVRDLKVKVQNTELITDFYVLPLEGTEMVLGVAWMATLGPVTMDFSQLTFEFRQNNTPHRWQGETDAGPQLVQLQSIRRMGEIGAVAEMYHLQMEQIASPTLGVEQEEMQKLLDEFKMVFEATNGLPPERKSDHSIHLFPTSKPVNVRPYRYPHFQKGEIERQVQCMLDGQLIQRSSSPFSSPVLLVKKKDGSWRFCVDYRALNAITIKDKYPIPTVDELFDELGASQFFSKLDLLAGYHQIRVRAEDVHKTAFRTHEGHYEFRVMPFGLTNAPSTFQSTMNDIFRPYLRKFVLIFLDDILIFSRDWFDHLTHVRMVLEVLRDHGFVAKRAKCLFGQRTVEYLGHIVSREGLAVDPSKVEAIQLWPEPTTTKEVRGFLGLAGYYRKFIQGFATLASPLTDLLRKGEAFEWTDQAREAFHSLKGKLCSAPVLGLPDFTKDFVVETDASGVGIGAVLTQGDRPIAYYSQKLSPRMQGASTYHREMYAITQAVGKWRQYLLGRRFVIVTDQKSLRELTQQTIQTPEQQKWLSKLIGYDFEIRYRPSKLNSVADALSRKTSLSEEASLMAMSRPMFGIVDDIRVATENDPEMSRLKEQLSQGNEQPGYVIQDGLILYKGRIVVPKESALRAMLLREFHSSVVGGHAGIQRTLNRLSTNFYWKGLRKEVQQFVGNCQVCQRMKSDSLAPAGLLQPLPIPEQVFEDISMDFITGLPQSKGKEAIMVVVDRLTKYGHFFALPRQFDSKLIAKIMVQGSEMARLQGTELCMSSAYHPQTDGQTEALNRCLEMYLRCVAGDDPNKWESYLAWAEYWYNTAYQASASMTPFKALYGREPPTIMSYMEGSSSNTQLDNDLRERDLLLRELKQNLMRAQTRMKHQADKHRREVEFKEGEWAFVRLQPYRQLSLRLKKQQKLSPRFFGPYRIQKRVGSVAYKLELPDSTRIHPVFHVSQLKLCKGHPLQQITPLPLLENWEEPDLSHIATNLEESDVSQSTANLEDKVLNPEEGNVMSKARECPALGAGSRDGATDEPEPQNQPSHVPPVIRKGTRERKPPRALTDFVLR
ncbi:hypothetical protein HRI_001835200 [Hibiscus trionum]|uniref:Reverse transcriptase n=1 Tax=Hibiscus trionum TaxID=183268 RepID=A0A9W7HPE7_HIBTR|nr:hypothetical protein HRI_001835200 [Hibiscus trionum]